MNNKNNDLINKFLDDELSEKELRDIESKIVEDDFFDRDFTAAKMLDENLGKLNFHSAPAGFTEKFMLNLRYSKSRKDSFIVNISIVTFIIGIILSIAALFIFGNGDTNSLNFMPEVGNLFNNIEINLPEINVSLPGKTIRYVMLSLALLISFGGYYLYENHKLFKQRLNNR